MNGIRNKKLIGAILSGMLVYAQAATFAQDMEDDATSLQNGNARDVRPGQTPPPTMTTTPDSAVRGSLFRQGAMAPVPVGSDGVPIAVRAGQLPFRRCSAA